MPQNSAIDGNPEANEMRSDASSGTTSAQTVDSVTRESDLPASGITATVAMPSAAAGAQFGRYVLRSFHASGGMGEIWRCFDAAIGREVAMKRLKETARQARPRFTNEAQIAGQLEHPGIVPVHDLCVDDADRPYYIMKFVRGQTLLEAIREHHAPNPATQREDALRQSRLLHAFVELCHAIAYAHSHHVVHRDIKPENVMLGEYGETVVLDWGLAKVVGQPDLAAGDSGGVSTGSGRSTETRPGSVMGSPPYMAPEMADGHAAECDPRTDVYLLGSTLYEILTGHPPRQGTSRHEMVELARTSPPPPPRRLLPVVPRALDAICMKAMAYRKEDRYASAMDLAGDMQRYLAGEPVSAFPEGPLRRTWRWARRHRRALLRTAAALLVCIAGLVAAVKVREAKVLHRLEEARRQQVQFFNRVDLARFYAASTDAPAERAPYYDLRLARAAAHDAIAIADQWGGDWERMPSAAEERPRDALGELLLLMAQAELSRPPGKIDTAEAKLLLDRAGMIVGGRRSYRRLSAACDRALGKLQSPDPALTQPAAGDSQDPLDLFIEAESQRLRSASPVAMLARPGAKDPVAIEKAIEGYRRVLQASPRHYWAHFQLGRCLLSIGRSAEAVEALGACIALRPQSPWGYSTRGLAFGLQGRWLEAKQDLDRAVELDREFRPARLNRGAILWLQRDAEAAIAEFTAALAPPQEQCLAEGAFYRGQVYLQSGNPPRALQDFGMVAQQRPDLRLVHLQMAEAYAQLGEDAECLRQIDACLEDEPALSAAERSELRGRLLRQRVAPRLSGDARTRVWRLSLEQLERAWQLGGRSTELLADLGAACEGLGRHADAERWYTRAIADQPKNAALRVTRGWLYANRPLLKMREALADFAEAVRLDDANARAHTGAAYAQACLGLLPQSGHEAARALLLGGNDYLVLHSVACAYAQSSRHRDPSAASGDQELAVALLKRSLELARRDGWGAQELENIASDSRDDVFPDSMRRRADFRQILGNAKAAE